MEKVRRRMEQGHVRYNLIKKRKQAKYFFLDKEKKTGCGFFDENMEIVFD